MNPGTALRRALQDFEIPHQKFAAMAERLESRIADAEAGYDPTIDLVLGPSRVGKSALIRHLQRRHSGTPDPKGRRFPVLFATVTPGVSWTALPRILVDALKVPPPRMKTLELTGWLGGRLEAAGTHTIVFEEASHLVDVGSRVPPRAAGDWFKTLSESNGISLLMFGVPRLTKLFGSNEQLDERAFSALEFRPYDSEIQADLKAFAGCVNSYRERFAKAGFQFWGTEDGWLTGQLYLLTGGLIGSLSKFMKQLAKALEFETPRMVVLADYAAATAIVKSSGHPDHQPFVDMKPPSKIALAAAHSSVLQKNGMSVVLHKNELVTA